MKTCTQVGAALMLILGLSLGHSSQAAESRAHVGDVERVQKQAKAVYQTRARSLSAEAPVLFKDLLKTGRNSRLTAKLADGTELTLGENAEMRVDEFVYEPDGNEGLLSIKVVRGTFMFVGGKVEEMANSRVQIETSAGVVGVRGTTVWGGPIDGGWGMLVFDGSVTLTTPRGEVTVDAGRGTMIYDDDLPPFPSFPWSQEKSDRAMATIGFQE